MSASVVPCPENYSFWRRKRISQIKEFKEFEQLVSLKSIDTAEKSSFQGDYLFWAIPKYGYCSSADYTFLQWNLNKVSRDWQDWGNLFVALRVRYFEHLHLTNFRENHQNVRYIEVELTTSNNQGLRSADDNDRRSKCFCSISMLCASFMWQII